MLISKSFIFTTRNVSENIKNKSYRWMIRAGLIYQEANGIFHYLPIMKRVLDNIEKIVKPKIKIAPNVNYASIFLVTSLYKEVCPDTSLAHVEITFFALVATQM